VRRGRGEKRNETGEVEGEGARDEREDYAGVDRPRCKVNVPFVARAARYSRMPHRYLYHLAVPLSCPV